MLNEWLHFLDELVLVAVGLLLLLFLVDALDIWLAGMFVNMIGELHTSTICLSNG